LPCETLIEKYFLMIKCYKYFNLFKTDLKILVLFYMLLFLFNVQADDYVYFFTFNSNKVKAT